MRSASSRSASSLATWATSLKIKLSQNIRTFWISGYLVSLSSPCKNHYLHDSTWMDTVQGFNAPVSMSMITAMQVFETPACSATVPRFSILIWMRPSVPSKHVERVNSFSFSLSLCRSMSLCCTCYTCITVPTCEALRFVESFREVFPHQLHCTDPWKSKALLSV